MRWSGEGRLLVFCPQNVVSNELPGRLVELDPFSKPIGRPSLIDIPGGDRQHGLFRFVDVWGIGMPGSVVQVDEHDQACPCGTLVPVGSGWLHARRHTNTAALS